MLIVFLYIFLVLIIDQTFFANMWRGINKLPSGRKKLFFVVILICGYGCFWKWCGFFAERLELDKLTFTCIVFFVGLKFGRFFDLIYLNKNKNKKNERK